MVKRRVLGKTRRAWIVLIALIALNLGESALAAAQSYIMAVTGQGFDTCGIPTLSALNKWWWFSPYSAVNLYIGGSARACSNSALTSSYTSQIAQQGWKMIPTWVGPQAPCSGYASRINYDTGIAYSQGISEAVSAITSAANLGLADVNKQGSIIYYDLEAYDTGNASCRAAVNSFISGWTSALHSNGNLAGAYGAACGSAPSDWANIANVPDDLWVAWWAGPYQYRPNASVFGAPCLDDTLWVNHQRLRQYAGGHDETWAGVTLNIDSDVMDGIVSSLSVITKPFIRKIFPLIVR